MRVQLTQGHSHLSATNHISIVCTYGSYMIEVCREIYPLPHVRLPRRARHLSTLLVPKEPNVLADGKPGCCLRYIQKLMNAIP